MMFVKNRMTKSPYTITADASISDAVALLRERGLRRLPVVDGDKVVGLITEGDIQKVSPTKATSLSIFEINYLLSKLNVKDVMSKKPITIGADSLLEEAAVLMRENKVGVLPVVENEKLVGIITESDIFDAFIDLLGFKDSGSRITVEAKDVPGAMADIAKIYKSLDINITHIAIYGGVGVRDIVIRSRTRDISELKKNLDEQGYKVKHVFKNE